VRVLTFVNWEGVRVSKAWMPMYWGDYLRDTPHLSTTEHGAYLLIIAHYWCTGPIPNETSRLARITRMSYQEWVSLRGGLLPFFTLDLSTNRLHHKRIDAELEKSEKILAKRQLAGAKGGWKSRGKTNQQRNYDGAFAKQMGDQSQSHISTLTSFPGPRSKKDATEEER
jgi:uncharacterized protein YdaU (DUF1376 family)